MEIIKNEEIKALIGVSASTDIRLLADAMTEQLAEMLGILDFGQTEIELEEIKMTNDTSVLYLKSWPVDTDTLQLFYFDDPTDEITGLTFRVDPYHQRKIHVMDAVGNKNYLGLCKLYASYTGGYANADDVPSSLKVAVAYMVAGAIADKSQAEGIVSYRLGTKSINFRDMSEKNYIEDVVKKYGISSRRATIIS